MDYGEGEGGRAYLKKNAIFLKLAFLPQNLDLRFK
jgi:hypothetical protein